MQTALFIVVGVAAVAAGWAANALWVRWEREYRTAHRGPPPGGDALGYVAVIGAFFITIAVTTNLLLWMG